MFLLKRRNDGNAYFWFFCWFYCRNNCDCIMTPIELFDKYKSYGDANIIGRDSFLAALKEYGELVKAEAVKVCNTVESVKWNMHLSGKPTTLKCSDAIKDMKLP